MKKLSQLIKLPLIDRLIHDTPFRINAFLLVTLIYNVSYSILQFCLGIYNKSIWYLALSGYYIILAVIRFFLFRYIGSNTPGENLRKELYRYLISGFMLLLMNLAISAMTFFIIFRNNITAQHEIITITMATYTFTSFTMAVINIIKYRKLRSPVFSACAIISLAEACFSMLTLEATMLQTFGKNTTTQSFNTVMLILTSAAITVFTVITSVYMVVSSILKLKKLKYQGEIYGKR